MAMTCYRCGSEMLSMGALFSGIRTSFRPQESKFLTLETGDIMTKATMCRGCGVVEIVGDVNKLKRLTSDPETPAQRLAGALSSMEIEVVDENVA